MFDLDGLRQAEAVVYGAMPPTPQYRWPGLSRRAGCEVWVKHENHTPTGAFKVRGGLVLFDELHRTGQLPRKVITATRGNHGQSIPFAASRFGVPVTVLAPRGNSCSTARRTTLPKVPAQRRSRRSCTNARGTPANARRLC